MQKAWSGCPLRCERVGRRKLIMKFAKIILYLLDFCISFRGSGVRQWGSAILVLNAFRQSIFHVWYTISISIKRKERKTNTCRRKGRYFSIRYKLKLSDSSEVSPRIQGQRIVSLMILTAVTLNVQIFCISAFYLLHQDLAVQCQYVS